MIIREYRILLPLTVSEYQIAQLFMLIKKSQTESTGEGNGVLIIKNEPYRDDETLGNEGQYTLKILHVGSHIPKWLLDISPQDAFKLSEESWNAYPFVKTVMTSLIAGDKFRYLICYFSLFSFTFYQYLSLSMTQSATFPLPYLLSI